jgi:hypothetical protein
MRRIASLRRSDPFDLQLRGRVDAVDAPVGIHANATQVELFE